MFDAAAIVLAGGKSQRMGRDKASLLWEGKTMLERTLGMLLPEFPEIVLVGRTFPDLDPKVHALTDELPGQGPLGGLVTALSASGREWNFLVACDMPFLDPLVFRTLWEYRHLAQAVVPVSAGRCQPLCGLYHRGTLAQAKALLGADKRSMMGFLEGVHAYQVPESLCVEKGISPKLFTNLNTPEDYSALVEDRLAH